jgi:histidinol dehydrogenase
LRRSSVLSFTPEGLAQMAGDVLRLAHVEGLTAHAASISRRMKGEGGRRNQERSF